MATNPTYKPSEGKREEFRRYLEKTGVMDALTKGLVCLYEEPDKPADALLYLLNKLSVQSGGESFDELKSQLQEAKDRITALEEENNQLKSVPASDGGGGPEDEPPAEGFAPENPDAPSEVAEPQA